MSDTTSPVVRAGNLVAGYIPGVNILNDCTLEAFQGELVGIIGPNGAGKSTLLKALFGLVTVTSGTVTLAAPDGSRDRQAQLVAQELCQPQQDGLTSGRRLIPPCAGLEGPSSRRHREVDVTGVTLGDVRQNLARRRID